MSSMFYVWDEGCWREVNMTTGAVSEHRERAQFLYRRGGQLNIARREEVLTGLRALEAGAPTTEHDGTPVPQISRYHSSSRVRRRLSAGFCARCCRCKCKRGSARSVPPSSRPALSHSQKQDILQSVKNMLVTSDNKPAQPGTSARPPASTTAGTSAGVPVGESVDPTASTPGGSVAGEIINKFNEKAVTKARLVPQLKQNVISTRLSSESSNSTFQTSNLKSKLQSKPILSGHIDQKQLKPMNNQKQHSFTEHLGSQLTLSFAKEPADMIMPTVNNVNRDSSHSRCGQGAVKVTNVSKFFSEIVRQTDKTPMKRNSDATSRDSSERTDNSLYKELSVTEDDIASVRGLLEAQAPELLVRFDLDEAFKRKIFYSINPLVHVERSTCLRLVHFMAQLGLRSTPVSGDKENRRPRPVKVPQSSPRVTQITPLAVTSSGLHPTLKTSYSSSKEYSELEDQVIVEWVSRGQRAHRVNGNELWVTFEGEYRNITGRERTWQSLRNRYLRYLLPGLSCLSLSPRRAADLRAAAAAGIIKSRKLPPRRNSIFGPSHVRSAFARRLRPVPRSRAATVTSSEKGLSRPHIRASLSASKEEEDQHRPYSRGSHAGDTSSTREEEKRHPQSRASRSASKRKDGQPRLRSCSSYVANTTVTTEEKQRRPHTRTSHSTSKGEGIHQHPYTRDSHAGDTSSSEEQEQSSSEEQEQSSSEEDGPPSKRFRRRIPSPPPAHHTTPARTPRLRKLFNPNTVL